MKYLLLSAAAVGLSLSRPHRPRPDAGHISSPSDASFLEHLDSAGVPHPDWSAADAGLFVGAATDTCCPQYNNE
jgi:hypothetical protein